MKVNFKNPADFRKSLETRLQTIAQKTGGDLQRIRRKVAFDRLLARLFFEDYPNFFLKGGYAMELRLSRARATRDIDLTCTKKFREESGTFSSRLLEELRMLARRDLDDFFIYQIGEAQMDLDGAPYGGARYPVSALIDRKLFIRFQLDVGADAVVDKVEVLNSTDWLGFCGIPAPTFSMISAEQQFAEKLHSYTLPRTQGLNTRAKDLVDMILLIRLKPLNFTTLENALQKVFSIRATHPLPKNLETPPNNWQKPFDSLAKECALNISLHEAYEELVRTYAKSLTTE